RAADVHRLEERLGRQRAVVLVAGLVLRLDRERVAHAHEPLAGPRPVGVEPIQVHLAAADVDVGGVGRVLRHVLVPPRARPGVWLLDEFRVRRERLVDGHHLDGEQADRLVAEPILEGALALLPLLHEPADRVADERRDQPRVERVHCLVRTDGRSPEGPQLAGDREPPARDQRAHYPLAGERHLRHVAHRVEDPDRHVGVRDLGRAASRERRRRRAGVEREHRALDDLLADAAHTTLPTATRVKPPSSMGPQPLILSATPSTEMSPPVASANTPVSTSTVRSLAEMFPTSSPRSCEWSTTFSSPLAVTSPTTTGTPESCKLCRRSD